MTAIVGATQVRAETAAPAPAAADAADAAPSSDEIIVTSRKREERLSDIPLTIKALSASEITRKGIRDLQDVADLTPGLRFTDYLTKFNGNPTIRGLEQNNVQAAIGNVGVFEDGIYLQRGYMVDQQLGDIERIEIVKGPQSALYGQNTFAGLINYVIRKPTDELKVDLQGSLGNAGFNEFRAGVGGPIIKGLLDARVYYARGNYDGTWVNSFPGAASTETGHFGGYKRQNFTGSLLLTPAEGLSITGTYSSSKRHEQVRAFYTIDANNPEDKNTCGAISSSGAPYLWCGNLPSNVNDKRSGNATNLILPGLFAVPQPGMFGTTKLLHLGVNYHFSPSLTFSYDFGHVRGTGIEETALAGNSYMHEPSAAQTILVQREGGLLVYDSHEAKLAFDNGGPFKVDGGVFMSTAKDTFFFGVRVAPVGQPVLISSLDPTVQTGFIQFTHTYTEYQNKSAYLRASYSLFDDRLTIAGEGRYTHSKNSTLDYLAPDNPELKSAYNDFTPRGSIQFKLTPETMIYGSVARGAKAGGFNGYVSGSITLLPSEQSYGEEKNTSYELGVKGEAFDRKLNYEVSLYWVNWTNRQIPIPPANFDYNGSTIQGVGGVPSIYKTAGNARSRGIEISGTYHLTPELSFNIAATYQDARIMYSKNEVYIYNPVCDNVVCNTNGDNDGHQLPFQPKIQGSGGFDYHRTIGHGIDAFVGADEIYRGHTFVDDINVTGTAPYFLTNAHAGLSKGPWQAIFWVKNAFDRRYVDAAFSLPTILQNDVNLGELRTFGATVSYNF